MEVFVVGEQELLLKVVAGGGTLGTFIFFATKYGVKAIEKLYTDMREQHKEQLQESVKREDRLMDYLDEKNKTDAKVAETLETICSEMGCMNTRLEYVEKVVERRDNIGSQKDLS